MGGATGKAMTICLAVMHGAVTVYTTRRNKRDRAGRTPVRFLASASLLLPQRVLPDPIVGWARAGPERLQVFRL